MRVLLALAPSFASFALAACAPGVSVLSNGAANAGSGNSGDSAGSPGNSAPNPGTGSSNEAGSGTTPAAILRISGSPQASATEGVAYSFVPATSEPTSPLTFTVSNAPDWTTFDPKVGALSGVPDADSVGTYSDIVISVSDGKSFAALPAFQIQVNPDEDSGSGKATLAWDPPTTNVDGTPLAGLAGYRINYGKSAVYLDHSVVLSEGSATTYSVMELAPGTWYFSVQAISVAGPQSAQSNIVDTPIT
jgi:hypothetical protein